ncbi:MAG TPA: peptide chain release factor N(5)-glutamine methyltransferase [Saprospiraceae bacterium]|jgi:release factor glutamine methyltransferase
MDSWSITRIADQLEGLNIALDREAMSMARWIWMEILMLPKDQEAELTESNKQRLAQTITRLVHGEPVQYIAGHAWFYGLKFHVNPDVLIPRPETEEIVEWILSDLKNSTSKGVRILDIGTGSGCIAITLKKHLGQEADVMAIDVSEGALNVSKMNSEQIGVDVDFRNMDFLSGKLDSLGLFDIIVSNPPYVSKDIAGDDIIHRLKYEPELALYPSGSDPDIFYKKFSSLGNRILKDGGSCYFELNEFRAKEIEAYFNKKGWGGTEVRIDLQGMPRMLKTTRK